MFVRSSSGQTTFAPPSLHHQLPTARSGRRRWGSVGRRIGGRGRYATLCYFSVGETDPQVKQAPENTAIWARRRRGREEREKDNGQNLPGISAPPLFLSRRPSPQKTRWSREEEGESIIAFGKFLPSFPSSPCCCCPSPSSPTVCSDFFLPRQLLPLLSFFFPLFLVPCSTVSAASSLQLTMPLLLHGIKEKEESYLKPHRMRKEVASKVFFARRELGVG